MKRARLLRIACLLLLALGALSQVQAQNGVFGVSSAPADLVRTEKTALLGSITFTLTAGTTGSGTLVVDYKGAPIVNNAATGITATGTGGLAAASVGTVDVANSTISIAVPAGASAGSIVLEGVRIDEVAAGLTSLTVTVSVGAGSGFGIIAGQTEVPVIKGAKEGLVVSANSDTVLSYDGIPAINTALMLKISEGFANVFSDAIGTFGQNIATQVRIEVTDLPAGSKVTFPNSVTAAETGATLTALAGSELTLPNSMGETFLIYQFASVPASAGTLESFTFFYTLDVQTAPTEPAVVSLQATLFPTDATKIPSFVKTLVPAEEDLPFPEFTDTVAVLPGTGNFLGLAFTNGTSSRIFAQLRALDPSGQLLGGADIVNPVDLTLDSGVQQAGLLEELFGSGILNAQLGTVVITSRKRRAVSLFLLGDLASTFLDGAGAGQSLLKDFVLPNIAGDGVNPFTTVQLFNPSTTQSVSVNLSFRDAAGMEVASADVNVGPEATTRMSLTDLFGSGADQLGGLYLRGSAPAQVSAFQLFGNDQALNVLPAQSISIHREDYYVPHFAVGGGYDTEVSLINTDPLKTAQIQLSLLDDAGGALAQAPAPVELSLKPGEAARVVISALLGGSPSGIVTGSVHVKVSKVFTGPFVSLPALAGSVRVESGGGNVSATLPLFSQERTSALYPHVAQTLGFFTGVAVFNPGQQDVDVTVSVFDQPGNLVGASTFTLPAAGRRAKLLNELIPASDGQQGGYFRVSAPSGVISFALFGDLAGQFISAIPSQ